MSFIIVYCTRLKLIDVFFNDTAPPVICARSLRHALPILHLGRTGVQRCLRSHATLCHGFEPGVLAGKLCVRDAQMSNAVYVPTPPYVMGLSQASWQGSGM